MSELELVKGEDGSVNLVGVSDGARLVFATVNASQVSQARVEQALGAEIPGAASDEPETPADTTPAA
jgi:hypothetical protein